MKIGTYYYPEQWPAKQWHRDFDNIAAMGLQIVHMAEFAWYAMEPSPGDIRLDWLYDCVEMAAKRKLAVILCTPTAAPPVWLSAGNPETIQVDEHGTAVRFGGRRHYTPTSSVMREATKRIVGAMAERFGNHPSVIGWQIDNEYSSAFDQSEQTHAMFREWLKRKYGTIENVNKAWACQFWNTYYTDFSQILLPKGHGGAGYGNPHHTLDGSRFWSWAFADFNKLQADILKPHIGDRFITTNFMPFCHDIDPKDMADDLTLFSWDSYPVTGWDKNPKDQTYRMADPSAIGIVHDQMAGYHGRWALMELQPGQVNWTGVPVLLYPGAVRLWIWTAFAHGAEFVTTYRYRQPLFNIEMFHHGLVGTDGVTLSPGGREFMQAITEMRRLDLKKIPDLSDESDGQATVGLVFDFDQLWYYKALPQARRWDQMRWLMMWYGAITKLGLKVKILQPGGNWPVNLPMVIAPGVQMVDDAFLSQCQSYIAGGGHLVLTCRTGLMDRTGQFFEGSMAKPILPLIGGMIEAYDGLPDDTFGMVEMDGKQHPWGVWGDLLYAEPDTKVLAKYGDQFYAGAAAVIQKKHAAGIVTYCGVFGEALFTNALVEKLATQAKIKITLLPARVQMLKRGPYRIVLNYQDATFDAPAPRNAKFLVGNRRVEPAGVAIWEE